MTLIYKTILLLKTLCWNAQIRTGDTTSKELCVTATPRSNIKNGYSASQRFTIAKIKE